MALGAIPITGAPAITTPPGSLPEPTLYHDLRPSLQLAQERLLTHGKRLSYFHPKSRAKVTIGHPAPQVAPMLIWIYHFCAGK